MAIFGGIKRQSYRDIFSSKDYLQELQVGEIPEQLAVIGCDRLLDILPECKIILRVQVIGEIEHFPYIDRQRVEIREVYKGEDLSVNEEIFLTSDSWCLCLDDNPNSIERSFVNVMDVNDEYLVFCSEIVESLDDNIQVCRVYSDSIIIPVFSYKDRENVIVPVEGDTTYVPYYQVKDNEFFAESEVALEKWEMLKKEMLDLYPYN